MPQPNGGARPGAGRPRKLDKYGGQIAAAEDKIADCLPEVVEALIVSAKTGDTKAGIYLLDRLMGKPVQALEHSGPDGEAIPFDLKSLPAGDLDAFERIVRRMAGQQPGGGAEGDRGGADSPGPR